MVCPKPSVGQLGSLEMQYCDEVVIVSSARDQKLVRKFGRADRVCHWCDTAAAVLLGNGYEVLKVRKGLDGNSWSEISEPCL